MALKDWELKYDYEVNKWVWRNIKDPIICTPPKPSTRKRIGEEKNGYYPFEFNFITFSKGAVRQCSYCGIFLINKKMTRDHVYPKSKGGVATTPACKPCNDIKRNMLPIDFAIWYSKLGKDLPTIPIGFNPEDS